MQADISNHDPPKILPAGVQPEPKALLSPSYHPSESVEDGRWCEYDTQKGKTLADAERELETEGQASFHRLGWKRLTVVLIVDAIAMGSLSIPSAFATLGMVVGVICCVVVGLLALYGSYVIGQVKLAHPEIRDYADAGRLLMGSFGYWVFSAAFVIQILFVIGSHCLAGTIAFRTITQSLVCSQVFGVVSMVLLFLLAVPPTFADVAILGYIDIASILLAIGITIIATGIQSTQSIGLSAVDWSVWPKENVSFTEAFNSISNIVFAYSFATCQFSFMNEMHTPQDYVKSVWSLALAEIFIYTITGATIYAFVGSGVASPALLSAGTTVSRVAFGVALPVIFISGSINITVIGRYIHGRMYRNSVHRFVNTRVGWISWLAVVLCISIIVWIIAEAIPVFSDILAIAASLFSSGFSFYIPAIMWFILIRKESWTVPRNMLLTVLNIILIIVGLAILGCGVYAVGKDLANKSNSGAIGRPFTCS